jgi:hypothetical protein
MTRLKNKTRPILPGKARVVPNPYAEARNGAAEGNCSSGPGADVHESTEILISCPACISGVFEEPTPQDALGGYCFSKVANPNPNPKAPSTPRTQSQGSVRGRLTLTLRLASPGARQSASIRNTPRSISVDVEVTLEER